MERTSKRARQQHSRDPPRPRTLPFAQAIEEMSRGTMSPALYTLKEDGFCILIREIDHGPVTYHSKNGRQIEIREPPLNSMEAIAWYLHTKHPELRPSNFTYLDTQQAWELRIEFIASPLSDPTFTSRLQPLFHKQCFDSATGMLDETNFRYCPVVHDARFNEEGDVDHPYHERLASIHESQRLLVLGQEDESLVGDEVIEHRRKSVAKGFKTSKMIECADELIEVFTKEEGVVCHTASRDVWKIKLPGAVMKARILAVYTPKTDAFPGYSMILVGLPRGSEWSAVYMFDWTEVFFNFDRPRQGRAFIPPQSVKVEAGGLVVCTGNHAMQPLVDAVFRAVSKAAKFPPVSLGATEAVMRMAGVGPVTVRCGRNRSFSLAPRPEDEVLFLADPVDVTLGCGRAWEIPGEGLHLQPAWLLALEGYGHEAYREIERCTPLELMLQIAREEPGPYEAYRRVGMRRGPFLGLEDAIRRKMTGEHFFPS